MKVATYRGTTVLCNEYKYHTSKPLADVEIWPDPVKVLVPAPTKSRNREAPCTEGAPMVQHDLSGRSAV